MRSGHEGHKTSCKSMAVTDDKIKKAIQESEQEQEEAVQKRREEMMRQVKRELKAITADGVAIGGGNTGNLTGASSKVDPMGGGPNNPRSRNGIRERCNSQVKKRSINRNRRNSLKVRCLT